MLAKYVLLGCLSAVFALQGAAQTPTVPTATITSRSGSATASPARTDLTPAPAATTVQPYDSTALRIEQHGSSTRIVRGVRGPILWSEGFLSTSGNLERVVARSPGAVAEARIFNRRYRRGTINVAIGFSAFVASLFTSGTHPSAVSTSRFVTSMVLGVGGGALMFYGNRDLNRASTALSRSVLLYNGDLPR